MWQKLLHHWGSYFGGVCLVVFLKKKLDSVKIINDRLKLVSEKYLLKCEAQIRQNRLRQGFAIEKVQIESYGKVTDC